MRLYPKSVPRRIRGKLRDLEKKYYGRVFFPEELEIGFDDLIGMEAEKEVLLDAVNFFKDIDLYSSGDGLCPHTRYLLRGDPGAGKMPLLLALAKESDVPLILIDASTFSAFPSKVTKLVDLIFDISKKFKQGCIIVISEFATIGTLESEYQYLLHNHLISRIAGSTNNVVFLTTTVDTISVPPSYLGHNLFSLNKVIAIKPPTLETRKKLLVKFLDESGYFDTEILETDDLIERLARNTLGMYPKTIEYAVEETILRAMRDCKKEITFNDFLDTLLTMEAGEKHNKLTEKEREEVAYHEAGHVVVAYNTDSEYIPGRVEITPRTETLGITQQELGDEKFHAFRHEKINRIMRCLGGMAAEQVVYGETTDGVTGDLATATWYAMSMFAECGMDEELGPIFVDNEDCFSSERLNAEVEKKAQALLKELYKKRVVSFLRIVNNWMRWLKLCLTVKS